MKGRREKVLVRPGKTGLPGPCAHSEPRESPPTPAAELAAHLEIVVLRAQLLHLPQQLLFLHRRYQPGLFSRAGLLGGPGNRSLRRRATPGILRPARAAPTPEEDDGGGGRGKECGVLRTARRCPSSCGARRWGSSQGFPVAGPRAGLGIAAGSGEQALLVGQGLGGAVRQIRAAVRVTDAQARSREAGHGGNGEDHRRNRGGEGRGPGGAGWGRPGNAFGFAALGGGGWRLGPGQRRRFSSPEQRLGRPRACCLPGARSGLGTTRCSGPGARRRLVLRAGGAATAPGEAAGSGQGRRRGRRLAREVGRARGGGRRGSAGGGDGRGWAGRRGPAVQVLEERSGGRRCAVQPPALGQWVKVMVAVVAGRLRLGVRGAAARGAIQRLHGWGRDREQQFGRQMLRVAAATCSLPARSLITVLQSRPVCASRSRPSPPHPSPEDPAGLAVAAVSLSLPRSLLPEFSRHSSAAAFRRSHPQGAAL